MKIPKTVELIVTIILGLFITSIYGCSTSAESVPTTVNIKPSLSISIPESTISIPLDPSNNDFGTNSTTITVATNNPNGYKLYLSSSTTDLVNTTNSTYTIPTLESSTPASTFPANHWGYKIDTSSTNYLPYQSDALISQSSEATNGVSSTIDFAAKVDYTKPAGLYSLSFNLKTIPIVTQYYMQELTSDKCTEDPMIVADQRDEQFYSIRRINGTCWMTDNLRLGQNNTNPDTTTFILTPENSNVTEERTIMAYDMTTHNGTNKECYGTYIDDPVSGTGAGYENPCMHSRENSNDLVGVWYNYALATADTVDNSTSSGIVENATESICPRGWTLPNLTQIRAIGPNTDTYVEAFAPVEGGFYRFSTTTSMTERGYFWSATAYNAYLTYTLRYNDGDNGRLAVTNGMRRNDALYLRCVLQEQQL